LDQAGQLGRTLAEVAPGSALRGAVTDLAITLSGRAERGRRSRRRRQRETGNVIARPHLEA
jgi:Flp pilus assembly CpaE family ATPase